MYFFLTAADFFPGAIETTSETAPLLPTVAYEESSLDSVGGAVTEEAGVLGAGLTVLVAGVMIGETLFIVEERLTLGDCCLAG
jgi:hypothetical protein